MTDSQYDQAITHIAFLEEKLKWWANRSETMEKHVDQLQAKLTCCCGSPIDHSAWEGHSPVSMYDHALDCAHARVEQLEAALRENEKRWRQFGYVIYANSILAILAPEQEK